MNRILILFLSLIVFSASSQIINNMVVFCNEPEPFTLILNGQRINMEPQTRVIATGLTLKKYDTKVIFKNPKLKEAKTVITFFSTGFECEFVLKPKGKKKHKIEYFTEKKIEGFGYADNNPNNNTNQVANNPVNNNEVSNPTPTVSSTPTVASTNTALTGQGTIGSQPKTKGDPIKCNSQLSDERVLSIAGALKNLPNDKDREAKALLMMEGGCLTVNQLKQLLNSFVSENGKYNFAKQVYERTKDNSEFIKLTETFVDVLVKDKFQKFLQSKDQ
jgi:hypothetical protein